MEKVTQVVPKSKGVGSSNRFDRAPGSGPIPSAKPAAGSSHYSQPTPAYYSQPAHNPSQPQYSSGPSSSQSQYASGQIPVQGPTDPRRALAAAAAVPSANALSSGQIPTRLNSGSQFGRSWDVLAIGSALAIALPWQLPCLGNQPCLGNRPCLANWPCLGCLPLLAALLLFPDCFCMQQTMPTSALHALHCTACIHPAS